MYQSENFDVFISYSTKNKSVADAVVSDLESHGIKCWYAPRNIMPGTEWVTAITEALNHSSVLVLIYTDDSNESRQVMNEIALQFNANKPIVPFRLCDTKMSSELEYYLTRVHWLDALDKTLPQAIEELRMYVSRLLEKKDSMIDTKTIELVNPVEGTAFEKYVNPATIKSSYRLITVVFVVLALAGSAVFMYHFVKMYNKASMLQNSQQESNVTTVTPDIPVPPETGVLYDEEALKDYSLADLEEFEKNNQLDAAGYGEIGRRYYYGIECDKDYSKALYYLIKSDDYDGLSGENCKILGDMYHNGYGVDINDAKAVEYYLAALDQEYLDVDIYRNLGFCYYEEEDYVQSTFYYSRAVALGNDTMDMTNAGIACYARKDYEHALSWFGRALDNDADNAKDLKKRIRKMVDDGYVSEKDASPWLDD